MLYDFKVLRIADDMQTNSAILEPLILQHKTFESSEA